jgi:hypothetical protein
MESPMIDSEFFGKIKKIKSSVSFGNEKSPKRGFGQSMKPL